MPNWEKERSSFKVCENSSYLMSAAIGSFHQDVYQAQQQYINDMQSVGGANILKTLELTEQTREDISKLFGGHGDDWGYGANTSQNINLLALMLKNNKNKKYKILMPEDEFPSSCLPWQYHDYEVVFIPSRNQTYQLEDFLPYIDDKTCAVLTSAVQFSTGYRSNLKELGKYLKEKNIPFFVNATQTLGHFSIDVEENHISALSCSVHKWLGSGLGLSLFYTSKDFREKYPFPLMGWLSVEDPMSMKNYIQDLKKSTAAIETGCLPYLNIIALNSSLKVFSQIGMNHISKRIFDLSNELESLLIKNGHCLASPRDQIQDWQHSINSGIIYINYVDKNQETPEEFEERLIKHGVYINARRGKIRISCHYFNNTSDFEKLLEFL